MNSIERKDKIIAATTTAVVAIIILLFLLFSSIGQSIEELIAQQDLSQEEEIFIEPELMNLGETEQIRDNEAAPKIQGTPQHSETPSQELIEQGESSTPSIQARQITQTDESQVQTTPPPATEQESRISSAMRDRFNRPNGNENASSNENGSGNSGIGKTGNLKGRTFLGCSNPSISISKEVTIIVRITVDENGNVTNASFMSDSGPGAGNKRLRDACVKASKNAKWSAKKGTATQTGSITWHLKPKS